MSGHCDAVSICLNATTGGRMTSASYTIEIVDDEIHEAMGSVYVHYTIAIQGKDRDVKQHIFSGLWAEAVQAALDLQKEDDAPIKVTTE